MSDLPSNLPEDQQRVPTSWSGDDRVVSGARDEALAAEEEAADGSPADPFVAAPVAPEFGLNRAEPVIDKSLLFESFNQPLPLPPPVRIPHLGHLLLVGALALMGLAVSVGFYVGGVHLHLFGVTSLQQAGNDIHYILGTEAIIYLFTFGVSLAVFPVVWHKSLFNGLQWNGATAVRLSGRLVGAAFVCFLLAWINGELMPGPTNTPIEKVFKTPGAAWLLFAFGVTLAPFFEEMFFRGFLLPALCTAYDWISEKITGELPRPLGEHGQPQWSLAAMVVGSIATSLPFAAMHAEQTGYAVGPFLLLVGVSLVLCGVRLATRSLASSVLVHACYNFMLFSLMLIGTGWFQHLDRM
jgi:membrane protease YdiL (CAAX protease family)